MINNLEILKPILHFEKDYYVRIIILSRLKDGHSTQKESVKIYFWFFWIIKRYYARYNQSCGRILC